MLGESRERTAVIVTVALTAVAGVAAGVYYAQAGLALAHHDARAHLVVARRILDSLMPGWQQIGAVWLPLPHLLNMLPVQVDAWYRSGASATAISIASMAVGAGALTSFIVRRTGSIAGALAGSALLMTNPSVLYLQSTPMTEPVLFGTTLLAMTAVANWLDASDVASDAPRASARTAGLALAAACMTRYEAWPICASLLALSAAVLLRRGTRPADATRATARVALYPAVAIAIFLLNSRWTVGAWFVSGGFFVPENKSLGLPWVAWEQVREGLYRLSSTLTVWPAYVAALIVAFVFVRSRQRASLVLVLALAAAAALPWYAYLQGHPLRIRYAVPLVVASAALIGTAIGTLPRIVRWAVAVALVTATTSTVSPLDRSAPLIVESQRDKDNMHGRHAVTEYLAAHHDGRPIMMSMGSLAHYMHDLSAIGLDVHDFLHEGNGEVWKAAMRYGPQPFVEWVAIEEAAEGGDAICRRARERGDFLRGFERVAEGGGVALYRTKN
jgi:hypothetical protein